MQVRASLWWLLSCFSVACARTPASQASERTRENAPIQAHLLQQAPHRAPFHAWLEEPQAPRPNQPFELIVHVERRLAVHVPIKVELRVPPSAQLTQGKSRATMEGIREGTQELRYQLTASSIPKEDLVVVLDAHGPGFGFHAELPYRFGRPVPELSPFTSYGPEARVGARKLGPSIKLRAK